MWFERYAGSKFEFAIFHADSAYDIDYCIFLKETKRLVKFIPLTGSIHIWIKIDTDFNLRPDFEYNPCVDDHGYLISLQNSFIDPFWKCPETYNSIRIEEYDDSSENDLYASSCHSENDDPQPSAEAIEKELEKNDLDSRLRDNEEEAEEDIISNLYFSVRRTGYYT